MYEGKVLVPVIDGRMQALDAATGKLLWSSWAIPQPKDGEVSSYSLTMAPRVAITALGSRPVLVAPAGAALVGTNLEDDAIAAAAEAVHKAARPMDNTSGTISQRKRAARVFTERALRALRANLQP